MIIEEIKLAAVLIYVVDKVSEIKEKQPITFRVQIPRLRHKMTHAIHITGVKNQYPKTVELIHYNRYRRIILYVFLRENLERSAGEYTVLANTGTYVCYFPPPA